MTAGDLACSWTVGAPRAPLQRTGSVLLVVDVLSFDFQFFLTGFAHPMVFSVDEGVVVDALSVVFGTEVAFHTRRFYRTCGSCFSAAGPSTTRSTRRFAARPSAVLFEATGRYSPYPTADIR